MWSRVAGWRGVVLLVVAVLANMVGACTTAEGSSPAASEARPSGATTTPTAGDPRPTGSPSTPTAASPRASQPTISDLGARLRATIDGIASPCAMVATEKHVWVTGNAPSVLARIDPSTNTIDAQTPMSGSPCGIALGPDGRIWVALLSVGRVVAVDTATAEMTATLDGFGAQLWDLKAGFGAVWLVDRSKRELVRIDPTTAAVTARIPIGRSGSGLAIAADAVWLVDDIEGTVLRIDPTTNLVTSTSELRRGSSWFANDDRALLVANRLDGSITPIDANLGTPGTPIAGSKSPLDGTVGGDRAYVPDGRAGTLVEIDLATNAIAAVDRLEGARNPFVAEIAFGDVWILDYGGERIWRIKP